MSKKIAAEMVLSVAETLLDDNPSRALELVKIAQLMGATPDMLQGLGADSGPENLGDTGIQDFNSENSGEMPGATNVAQNAGIAGNPNIEPFVNMKIQEPQADDRTVHTLTITLRAPEDISESDMMNYMLGMGAKMGVDIDGFKWSKSESKSKSV